MKTTITKYFILALLTTIIFMAILILTQHEHTVGAIPQSDRGSNYTFGAISSIQNDESGNPAWIVSGHWKGSLLGYTLSNGTQPTVDDTSPFGGSPFDTQFKMVRFDGTGEHTHTITNFIIAEMLQPDNMTKIFNGTSTASMREGPVTDIPTSIKVTGDKVVSIWLDPSRMDNHYGNTPIYGLVTDIEKPIQDPLTYNRTQLEV
jgi:hypothetical protein